MVSSKLIILPLVFLVSFISAVKNEPWYNRIFNAAKNLTPEQKLAVGGAAVATAGLGAYFAFRPTKKPDSSGVENAAGKKGWFSWFK